MVFAIQYTCPVPEGGSLWATPTFVTVREKTMPLINPTLPPVVITFAHVVPPFVVLITLAFPPAPPGPPSPTYITFPSTAQPQYISGGTRFPEISVKVTPLLVDLNTFGVPAGPPIIIRLVGL